MYPEEAQGSWDQNTQSWEEEETDQGQESWSDGAAAAAQSYTEPNWEDDGNQVGQGGWDDDGEAQVESGGEGGKPDLSGVLNDAQGNAWDSRISQIAMKDKNPPFFVMFSPLFCQLQ